jgi:L-ribulose-5-phosphate 3-epimerase
MPDRRSFVTASALALGSAALPMFPPIVQAETAPRRFRKALKYSMVKEPGLSVKETFQMLKDIGFEGTELVTADRPQRDVFREAIDATGLVVHGIVNSDNPDLVGAIEFAKEIGGTSVLVVARYDKKKPLMESWRGTQETIRAALPAAEKHEIKVLIENVWAGFLISALDAERYIDEINHPWFGSYFDIGNNVRWGVPEHWVEILGARIGKLDVKEWDERRHAKEGLSAGFGSPLGDGTINWEAVRASLAAIGFEGWATAEVAGGGRAELAEISRRMDQVLALS